MEELTETTKTNKRYVSFSSDGKSEQQKTEIDSVVFSVLNKFTERADFGMKKYGTNLDRSDLGVLDWIQHAQEEHMDAILYLEKLKQELTSSLRASYT